MNRSRLTLSLLSLFFSVCSLSLHAADKQLIPLKNKIADAKITSLFERGAPAVYSGDDLYTIGMPVGGIAAGQLYIRGDGTLGTWQIFNKHVFTGYGADCYTRYRPETVVDSGFAVAVQTEKGITVKRLDRTFGKVTFMAEYPIAEITYTDPAFPVTVTMHAFSPFIPLNAQDSALPGTFFSITMKNTSQKQVNASLLCWLENAVCIHSAKRIRAERVSTITGEKGKILINHTAQKAPLPTQSEKPEPAIVLADFEGADYGDWKTTGKAFGAKPAKGTLPHQQQVSGFLGKGLANSYLGKDEPQGTLTSHPFTVDRKFINFLIGGGNTKNKTCINLIVNHKTVRTATGRNNEKLTWSFWNVEEFAGKIAVIKIVDAASGGWGHINIDHIELSDRARAAALGPLETLPDFGSLCIAFSGSGASKQTVQNILDAAGAWAEHLHCREKTVYPVSEKRSAAQAVCPFTAIKAGASIERTAVLAWFFPNHAHGHEYANRFKSAPDVAHYMLENRERLCGNTALWRETFYDKSCLPHWLLFRLHSTVGNLATGTCQWWENGRFWAWEGVGCCAGTCTHVWNYAHALARLFPQLERSARSMQDFGEGFDSGSGLVGFRSNRAYAADGQCGTILKAYREHTISADNTFLKKHYPRIKKALQFLIMQDGNDDGLIENSQHNTFDINFIGANTFVGSLYLAALRAGEEMAKERNDFLFASRCRQIFESGRKLTMQKLWDGEYFIQNVDIKKHPNHQYEKGCLSDQLFGQGWADQLALGYVYPKEMVQSALKAIWKYNWTPDVGPYNKVHRPGRWFARAGEAGLFTCTWPKSAYIPNGVRYKNEIWTGIEYQVAGHMVWEGLVEEALAICNGIHERYHPAKHNPFNEVECGDHYARALASWGVYTALSGYQYHGPKGEIGFAPRINKDNFRAAFTAAEGWGTYSQTIAADTLTAELQLRWGQLAVKTLSFQVPFANDTVPVIIDMRIAGKKAAHGHLLGNNGQLIIALNNKSIVRAPETLTVTVTKK